MQRLDLAGELVDLAVVVGGQALHLVLQVVDRGVHLVDAVGALLDEVLHHAHVHVDGLLKARHLVLQRLHLGLQLHNLFVCGKAGNGCRQRHGRDCQPKQVIANSHKCVHQDKFNHVSRRDYGTPGMSPAAREVNGRRPAESRRP